MINSERSRARGPDTLCGTPAVEFAIESENRSDTYTKSGRDVDSAAAKAYGSHQHCAACGCSATTTDSEVCVCMRMRALCTSLVPVRAYQRRIRPYRKESELNCASGSRHRDAPARAALCHHATIASASHSKPQNSNKKRQPTTAGSAVNMRGATAARASAGSTTAPSTAGLGLEARTGGCQGPCAGGRCTHIRSTRGGRPECAPQSRDGSSPNPTVLPQRLASRATGQTCALSSSSPGNCAPRNSRGFSRLGCPLERSCTDWQGRREKQQPQEA
jgi:hypothetical protein